MSHPADPELLQHRQLNWPADTPSVLCNAKLMAPASSNGLFIDTPEHIEEVLNRVTIIPFRKHQAALFIDLEGRTLCRDGTVSVLQIFAEPLNEVYLLDINALQSAAFTTTNKAQVSLKNVLEDDTILKAFFDVRNDSDALHFHYGIKLEGVIDVQLMHNILTHPNTQLHGLGYCIALLTGAYAESLISDKNKTWAYFTEKEGAALTAIKHRGSSIFKSDAIIGASFDQRPLKQDLLLYSIHDVVMLPKLYHDFASSLTPNQMANILKGSQHRVLLSQMQEFEPNKGHKHLGPWNSKSKDSPKLFWDFSDEERKERLHRRPWGRQQETERKAGEEARKPPRVPTGSTPEAWRDNRVVLPTICNGSGWTPDSEKVVNDAAAAWQQGPESPSPMSRNATKGPTLTIDDMKESYEKHQYTPRSQPPALSANASVFQPYNATFMNSSLDQSALSPHPAAFRPEQPSPPALTSIARRPSAFSDIADVFAEEAERASFTSSF